MDDNQIFDSIVCFHILVIEDDFFGFMVEIDQNKWSSQFETLRKDTFGYYTFELYFILFLFYMAFF